ncbi:hypothetical protein QBC32DRAFT_313569 [Pseudoneurospora amorphoporcata]|uniref:Uncharacterized protein n=1 Tax=Pseudoneurospora amorphoporcata TaxID=241081 RepID=A0AAN6NXG2_9PEZI|nr:hypothetical protein QBC32DRAFT_313569 [Pseudoneurospora amorphoporcata]
MHSGTRAIKQRNATNRHANQPTNCNHLPFVANRFSVAAEETNGYDAAAAAAVAADDDDDEDLRNGDAFAEPLQTPSMYILGSVIVIGVCPFGTPQWAGS